MKRSIYIPTLALLGTAAAASCGTQGQRPPPNGAAANDAGGTSGAPDSGGAGAKTDGGSADATTTGGNDGASPGDSGALDASTLLPAWCNGSTHTAGTDAGTLLATPALTVPTGFTIETIAAIGQARELAALPNGDLLVGTSGTSVYVVPNAESTPNAPILFASINDSPVQGVAFYGATCMVGIASQHGLYVVPYTDALTAADAGAPVINVRTGPTAHSVDASVDTDTHTTSSVAFSGGKAYVGVGSSCNACVEVDPTRGTIQEANLDGSALTMKATRFRNAIALATNPVSGVVWAGGAGQDDLALGHPYEFFDGVTLHDGVADYGWPDCEENQHAYVTGADCTNTVEPLVEIPAYSTIIGATFYPLSSNLPHAFPATYGGGLFLTAHGSWHTNADGTFYSPPRVAFVPMNGDQPITPANWSDATAQWTEFVGGFQLADGKTRIGRPTGIAVGAQGSLFVSDDQNGTVYRIRPM